MVFDFDLFVIGGGSGGVRAARLAAAGGKRVALAEEYRIGGTCVIRGCVPKKLFVYASHYAQSFAESAGFGWQCPPPTHDWQALIAAKDKEIKRLEGLYRFGLENNNVHIYESRAVFIDEHTLEIINTGEKIRAEKILIATGGCVSIPSSLKGAEYCLTSDQVFDLKTRPQSIVVLGGGYIAVEFANIFHGFGTKTHLAYRGDLFLRGFDDDLRQTLSDAMRAKGVNLIYGEKPLEVAPIDGGYQVHLSSGMRLVGNQVMVALGRRPNTQGLGLENAGVKVNVKGAVEVDAFMTTSQPHIWAVGDVTNRIALTPVAIHEAMCFIQTAFHNNPTAPDHDLVATAVFSQPELGTVGLSEEEACRIYEHVEVYRAHFRPMRYVISAGEQKMLMKLVVDGKSRQVVGVHILGSEAGEMIQLLGIALKGGLSKEMFDKTMAVHPTAAEELVTMYQPSYTYKNGQKQLIS
ncbi:glutathione-disulfide reductase [Bartonella sp. DGB2]|uniref:glutathione-disulfide reductase n=1 Tax=Bartonella sp. DGB2 TaxID=3388426 RepID=UPI003990132E